MDYYQWIIYTTDKSNTCQITIAMMTYQLREIFFLLYVLIYVISEICEVNLFMSFFLGDRQRTIHRLYTRNK